LCAVTYEHPLAYLLGLEGIALLRAFTGEHGRDFVNRRISEIRALLNDPVLNGAGVMVEQVNAVQGYRIWSATYDAKHNGLFDFDEAVFHPIIAGLPNGTALDAACGTGRHCAHLATQGFEVIGVDSSAEMLEKARARVSEADFRHGDLTRIPVDDQAVDLVLCSLALTHVPDLVPVLAEFSRVLKPGGRLLLSDVHPELVALGANTTMFGPAGQPSRLVGYRHRTGDYLRAALPVGFQVLRCVEPGSMAQNVTDPDHSSPADVGIRAEDLEPWSDWPYSLGNLVPEAAQITWNVPYLIIWEFQLSSPTT
jgi:SAM-dependent methyltransferase